MRKRNGLKWLIFVALTVFYGVFLGRLFNQVYQLKNLNIDQKKAILYSENAFYYKFYEDLVLAKNWNEKIAEFKNYDKVLYPEKVDAVSRFNIMPEITLAGLYKVVNNFKTIDIFDFYVWGSISVVALTAGFIFLLVFEMGGNLIGGCVAVFFLILSFPFSSRIIFYPALRENFGISMLLLQIWFLIKLVKQPNQKNYGMYLLGTVLHVLSWQFSQFTLLAELLSLIFLYMFDAFEKKTLKKVSILNIVALVFIFLFFMRNIDLVKSLFFGLNLAILLIFLLPLNGLKNILLNKLFMLFTLVLILGLFNFATNRIWGGDVAHVFEYFKFQLLNKQPDFHSMLYKCSGAFDGINFTFLSPLFKSMLIPFWLMSLLGVAFMKIKKKPEYWFLAVLSILYFCFGFIANRFIVLAMPFLCILTGVIFSDDFTKVLFNKEIVFKKIVLGFLIIFLGINFWKLTGELGQRMSEIGYIEKKTDMEVAAWAKNYTDKNAVFAGTMPVTSVIFLMADRRIANNPYYEDEINRNKTWELYRVYGRETESGYMDYLHKNKIDYLVINNYFCNYRDMMGCVVEDYYKTEDQNNNNPILCKVISRKSDDMKLVFDNNNYQIFKISK